MPVAMFANSLRKSSLAGSATWTRTRPDLRRPREEVGGGEFTQTQWKWLRPEPLPRAEGGLDERPPAPPAMHGNGARDTGILSAFPISRTGDFRASSSDPQQRIVNVVGVHLVSVGRDARGASRVVSRSLHCLPAVWDTVVLAQAVELAARRMEEDGISADLGSERRSEGRTKRGAHRPDAARSPHRTPTPCCCW